MLTVPDDLDKLLSDVRKSINDNHQFLKALVDEAVDESCVSDEDEDKEADQFEEL